MLGRVPRRVEHLELDVTDEERVAILQQARVRVGRVGVLPLRIAFIGEEELSAGSCRELSRSAHEVSVNVRFGHMRHTQPLGFGGGNELLDVAIGVEHDRLAGALAADQIARLRELGVVEALEKHEGGLRERVPEVQCADMPVCASLTGSTPMARTNASGLG